MHKDVQTGPDRTVGASNGMQTQYILIQLLCCVFCYYSFLKDLQYYILSMALKISGSTLREY